MHTFIRKFENAVRNPYVEISVGLVLVITGFAEAGESLFEDVSQGNIGAHHGIIVLGLAHAMKAIPSILGSLVLFAEADRENDK
ncbi:MAG: hypothetical protein HOK06_02670 [Rhodospirillaceae bacterium]|jgi:hypothetical protein|nr:hypothetical protein [Rhodospirillaceae bacterium]MBT4219447.1 hypothetical protein [Rhodospirillaceae bacterium]MBT4463667.1 hypothetical protein [Rhodospirillaceae bacterium]MBT5014704.1 hypothetical protein [Rhodospirillaceae bacterium]MBT5308716.1 hypothetical protein [Rhodospirillaceae bacterium]